MPDKTITAATDGGFIRATDELPANRGGTDVKVTLPLAPAITFNASDRTGAVDVTAELQAVVDAAAGAEVFIPLGTYLINELIPPVTGLNLRAEPRTVKFTYDSGQRCIFLQTSAQEFDQAVSDVSNVVNPKGEYKTRVTVTDATAFTENDQIFITSDDGIGAMDWNIGEGCRVLSTDIVNHYLYLDRTLALESDYVTTVNVVKIVDSAFTLYGIEFKANGDPWDSSITTRTSCVELRGQPNLDIRKCVFKDIWEDALNLWTTHTGIIEDCEFKDLPNIQNDLSALVTAYGVVLFAGCTDILVRNCLGNRLRHMITTGAQTGAAFNVDNWEFQGIPTYNVIDGCTCYNSYAAAFDQHEAGKHNVYKDCTAINPKEGPSSTDSDGTGISFRCMESTIINFTQIGGKNGIVYLGTEFNRKVTHTINGAVIKNLDTDGNATGIYCSNAEGSTAPSPATTDLQDSPRIIANNITIDRAPRAIYMQAFADLQLNNCGIRDTRNPCDMGYGARLEMYDVKFEFSDNGYQWQNSGVVLIRGLAGETSQVIGDNITIRIDQPSGANNPDYVLKANDSNGTREYDLRKVRIVNYNSEAETSYPTMTDGNATFTPSTAVKNLDNEQYKFLTAAYTLHSKDETVEVTSGTFDVSLPTAPELGKRYNVGNSGAGSTTLNGNGKLISGNATQTILTDENLTVIYNGTHWRII